MSRCFRRGEPEAKIKGAIVFMIINGCEDQATNDLGVKIGRFLGHEGTGLTDFHHLLHEGTPCDEGEAVGPGDGLLEGEAVVLDVADGIGGMLLLVGDAKDFVEDKVVEDGIVKFLDGIGEGEVDVAEGVDVLAQLEKELVVAQDHAECAGFVLDGGVDGGAVESDVGDLEVVEEALADGVGVVGLLRQVEDTVDGQDAEVVAAEVGEVNEVVIEEAVGGERLAAAKGLLPKGDRGC